MKGLKKIINSTLLLGMQLRVFYLFFSLRVFEMSFCSAGMLQVLFPLYARIEAFLGGNDLEVGSAAGLGSTSHWGTWLGITCFQVVQMALEWHLLLVHCHYMNLDQAH